MKRDAAKFISAEEEAEQRKRELSSLKNKSAVASVNSDVDLHDLTNADVPENQQLPEIKVTLPSNETDDVSEVKCELDVKSESFKVKDLGSVTPIKRNSILSSANPDMINLLNKIFSPDNAKLPTGTPISKKRMSSVAGSHVDCASTSNAVSVEVKITKSKLLQVRFSLLRF